MFTDGLTRLRGMAVARCQCAGQPPQTAGADSAVATQASAWISGFVATDRLAG